MLPELTTTAPAAVKMAVAGARNGARLVMLALVPALMAVVLLVIDPALSTVTLVPAVMPKTFPKIVAALDW